MRRLVLLFAVSCSSGNANAPYLGLWELSGSTTLTAANPDGGSDPVTRTCTNLWRLGVQEGAAADLVNVEVFGCNFEAQVADRARFRTTPCTADAGSMTPLNAPDCQLTATFNCATSIQFLDDA